MGSLACPIRRWSCRSNTKTANVNVQSQRCVHHNSFIPLFTFTCVWSFMTFWFGFLRWMQHSRVDLTMKAEKNLDPPQLMRVFTYGLVYSVEGTPPCQIKQVKSTAKLETPWFLVTETYSIVFLQRRLLSVSVNVRWGESRIESCPSSKLPFG